MFVVLTKLEEKWGGWSVGMAIFGPQFLKIVSHMLRGANSARNMEAFKGYQLMIYILW